MTIHGPDYIIDCGTFHPLTPGGQRRRSKYHPPVDLKRWQVKKIRAHKGDGHEELARSFASLNWVLNRTRGDKGTKVIRHRHKERILACCRAFAEKAEDCYAWTFRYGRKGRMRLVVAFDGCVMAVHHFDA